MSDAAEGGDGPAASDAEGPAERKRRSARQQLRLADAFGCEGARLRQWLEAARSKRNTFFRPTSDEWPALVERVIRSEERLRQLTRLLELQAQATDLLPVDHAVRELTTRVLREAFPTLEGALGGTQLSAEVWVPELRRARAAGPEMPYGLEMSELLVRFLGIATDMADDEFVKVVEVRGDVRTVRGPEPVERRAARGPRDAMRSLLLERLGNAAALKQVLAARAAMKGELVQARAALADCNSLLRDTQNQVAQMSEELRLERAQLEELRGEVGARIAEIEDLKQAIAATRREGNHSANQIRGKLRGALIGEYRTLLETALAASTDNPPSIGVVQERLERALDRIVRDVEWLDTLA